MTGWAVCFDLDDTLVETGLLKPLREARRWPQVYAALDRTRLMPGAHEMLAELGGLAELGVITMAPRAYAERLLEHHQLAIPVLVAYHDVPRGELKPHPRPILQAAVVLRVPPQRVIYVGDEARDIEAAHRAGAQAIAYGPAIRWAPQASTAAATASDGVGVTRAVRSIIDGRPE